MYEYWLYNRLGSNEIDPLGVYIGLVKLKLIKLKYQSAS